jgi:hypothetical protein
MCCKDKIGSIKNYTKKEVLEELFKVYEDKMYENTETNRQLTIKIVKAEEDFYNILTNEQKEQFETISDLKQINYEETDKNIFIFAFKLAVQLMTECIS